MRWFLNHYLNYRNIVGGIIDFDVYEDAIEIEMTRPAVPATQKEWLPDAGQFEVLKKNDDWYQYEIINVCMFLLTVESVLKTENELYLKNYFQATILFQLQFTYSICYVGVSFHSDWLAHCNLISSFVVLPNSHDFCTRTVSLFCECF